MAKSYWSHTVVWASLAGALAGCSAVPDSHAPAIPLSSDPLSVDGGNGEPTPRVEPPSRSGNPDTYRVFGRRYRVKETSEGYREQGIASWYGWDFHGRKTSSGPIYNMFDLTAAHKSLPIPTYVRVTNLENGRNVVVKVNDRGPFVGRRIIDLSYAAADRLGMLGQGTAQVEVAALEPYQSLPELAARRAENRERLASRQSRPVSKSDLAAIEFAREEPIRLAASGHSPSQSPLSRSDLATVRAESPEPSADSLSRAESKPEPAAIQIAREEPIRPLVPESSRSEVVTARAETPETLAGRPIQPESKSEPITIQIAREDSNPPAAPVVDTPSIRPVKETVTERGAARTRTSARSATPAVARAAPKLGANPAVAKSPIQSKQEARTRSPIRLASADTVHIKGKGAGEQRRSPVTAGGKNGRFESAVAPTGRRDGRPSDERAADPARRDTRKGSGPASRQEARAYSRDSGAAKPAAVRLAGLKVNRSRSVTD